MSASEWALGKGARAKVTDLLTGLIQCESPDPPGNEAQVVVFLTEWLRDHGFHVKTDEFAPNRINVLTRLSGGMKPALIFSAHTDTMPVGTNNGSATWNHDPFGAHVVDGKLYGRGAADMKSGLAAMAAAALKIKTSGQLLAGDLILAFSAGESSSCLGAKRMIERYDLKGAGALLVSEPSSLDLLIAETGALWLDITATGTPGHASGDGGGNAILRLIDFLDAVRDNPFAEHTHPLLGTASLAINTIRGGDAVNLTPDRAHAAVDIRTVPGMTTDEILAGLNLLCGDEIAIAVRDDKPPVVADANDPFIAICQEAIRTVRGTANAFGGATYFSDSCVLAPALGIPRAIIGPGELGMSGQRDEWVALDALYDAAAIFGKIASVYLSD